MLQLALALALLPRLEAQACACSRSLVLPNGAPNRPGEVSLVFDTSLARASDPAGWTGLFLEDRLGDSMAGMVMPPHRITSANLSARYGLPGGFDLGVLLPAMDVHHVLPSGMEGDVDSRDLGDVELTAGWGHVLAEGRLYLGANAGPTLPTGEAQAYSPVRSGRGTLGLTGQLQAAWKAGEEVSLLASTGGSTGFTQDPTGYWLGTMAHGALGLRWQVAEDWEVSPFTLLRWQGKDQQDALVYENSGYLSHDLSLGARWTFWRKDVRALDVHARAVAPVWQIVGDPMYIENYSVTLGLGGVVR